MQRKNKQLIVAFSYLAIFVLLVVFFRFLLVKPSCFDQKKNGTEEDIDCGGSCERECDPKVSLEAIKTSAPILLKDGNRVDAIAEMDNPNSGHGFPNLKYTLKFYQGDQLIGESSGKAYLLPKEKKNLIVTGISVDGEPDSAKLELVSGQEMPFSERQKPKLEVLNLKFGRTEETSTFLEATFQLANRSPNDFSVVDIEAVVMDSQGRPIALNKGNLNNVLSGDIRDFRFFWPNEFLGQPERVEIRAHSNVLDLENL
jgi:hypothetical protein